jgi:hypothetical protein
MFGQFAFDGAELDDVEEPLEVDAVPDDDVVGAFVVVLVAACAAAAPPKTRAPVMAVAAMAFRM